MPTDVARRSSRLGETDAVPGYLLLQAMTLRGWRVAILPREDGVPGVRVRASKPGRSDIDVAGPSVAEIAVDVIKAATR